MRALRTTRSFAPQSSLKVTMAPVGAWRSPSWWMRHATMLKNFPFNLVEKLNHVRPKARSGADTYAFYVKGP